MYKLHCDLCERDVSKDENVTTVTWEDNEGYTSDFGHIFRKPRKVKCHICDDCLKLFFQEFCTNVYKQGYSDGRESVPGIVKEKGHHERE